MTRRTAIAALLDLAGLDPVGRRVELILARREMQHRLVRLALKCGATVDQLREPAEALGVAPDGWYRR